MEQDPVRDAVAQRFRIYDEREESFDGAVGARLFYVMFDKERFDDDYDAVRRDLKQIDDELIVFLRRDGGEDILFVAERPPFRPSRNRMALTLLVLALLTTTIQGAVYWQGYKHAGDDWTFAAIFQPANLAWGALTFALPLMLILGIHESAHYIAARRHGLRATLPFFIPLPPVLFLFGTFGAFIKLQDPLPDRKALFDVGASGPIAGFLIAVPLLVAGAWLTGVVAEDVPDLDRPVIIADDFLIEEDGTGRMVLTTSAAGTYLIETVGPEDGWSYTATATMQVDNATRSDTFTARLDEGERSLYTLTVPAGATDVEVAFVWDDGLIEFGDPLLVTALNTVFRNDGYLTHPVFFAAWVGIFVTGLNLLPAGQLDGGHIARAVLGDKVRFAGLATMALLMILALQFSMWFVLALFLVLTGIHHPPPLNDRTPLGRKRMVLAAVTLLVLVVSFIPVPLIY